MKNEYIRKNNFKINLLIKRLIISQGSNIFIMIKTTKRLRLLLTFFSLTFLFCAHVQAQTERAITIDDAIELGLKNSNQIKTSMARLNVVSAIAKCYCFSRLHAHQR